MDAIVNSLNVHNKGCNGCKRHERDIMVTFTTDPPAGSANKMEFNDFFLTNEQAKDLVTQIQKALLQNIDEEEESADGNKA